MLSLRLIFRTQRHVLAIECDGATYHSAKSARDRDRLRQQQLEREGWRFHCIWSSDWFRDKEACADRAVAAYNDAVRAADDARAVPTSAGTRSASGPQQAPSPAPPSPTRREARPDVAPGYPLGEYQDAEVVSLARWISSDGVLRTQDELLVALWPVPPLIALAGVVIALTRQKGSDLLIWWPIFAAALLYYFFFLRPRSGKYWKVPGAAADTDSAVTAGA